jgi:ubiquinone/menaquinone biosynthesis C-methylase UbiE
VKEVTEYDGSEALRGSLIGRRKASYLAGDGADLAFKSNVLDMVVSFGGIGGNLLDKTPQAIREAGRVLKPGSTMIHEEMLIKEDSEGYSKLMELAKELGLKLVDKICTVEGIYNAHEGSQFDDVVFEIIKEGVGDPNRDLGTGLFPYPNEWYAEVLVKSTK